MTGFVANNLIKSELSDKLIKLSKKDNSFVIFLQNIQSVMDYQNCAIMNVTYLNGFDGKIIALDIDSAYLINQSNLNAEKIILLWNLEWLYNIFNYTEIVQLLDNFKIYVKSESHRKIVENFTGRGDINLIEDLEELL